MCAVEVQLLLQPSASAAGDAPTAILSMEAPLLGAALPNIQHKANCQSDANQQCPAAGHSTQQHLGIIRLCSAMHLEQRAHDLA